MIRLALSQEDCGAITAAFRAAAPKESGAFLLLRSAAFDGGTRLVASEPYFPHAREWDRIGAHQLRPGAWLLSAMVSRAVTAHSGLLFVHSHPNPRHPTAFSLADDIALESLGRTLPDLVDGPLAAAVAGPKGWVGRVVQDGEWLPINRLTAAGRRLQILEPLREPRDDLDDRQLQALGPIHRVLRNLDIVVVGCGGLGSPLAETLLRMGVRRMTLIDNQALTKPSNLRRVFGAKRRDLTAPPRGKAEVVAGHCRDLDLGCEVRELVGDVRWPRVFPTVLDADLVMCATDSHSSRAVLDAAAVAFNLPVIDCGVRVGVRNTAVLSGLVSEIRVLGPELPCLWCHGVLSAETIRSEHLPEHERAALRREGYLVGVEGAEPSVTALTVMGAGMMACALLAMLSEDGNDAPVRYFHDGFFGDHMPVAGAPKVPKPDCICRTKRSRGNGAPLGLVPE